MNTSNSFASLRSARSFARSASFCILSRRTFGVGWTTSSTGQPAGAEGRALDRIRNAPKDSKWLSALQPYRFYATFLMRNYMSSEVSRLTPFKLFFFRALLLDFLDLE